jgi:transcriptional regulator with XRE-family HTH domain
VDSLAKAHAALMANIGERLREERTRQGISQRELASRLGLSPSLISQIETGRSKPSVSTLYSIVTELRMSVDRLFEEPHGQTDEVRTPRAGAPVAVQPVVHPDERHVIELESGVRWERLTSDHDDLVDFLYVIYDVAGASSTDGTLMRHPGREYGYVISGRLGVQIQFQRYLLQAGDSFAFDSTKPHRLWNPGDRPAHALWCVVGREG